MTVNELGVRFLGDITSSVMIWPLKRSKIAEIPLNFR